MQQCESCRFTADAYDLLDFCAACGRNLCDRCMERGCCGAVPARSGSDAIEDSPSTPT